MQSIYLEPVSILVYYYTGAKDVEIGIDRDTNMC